MQIAPLWNRRFELSWVTSRALRSNPARRTFRLADRIPPSAIAGTYSADKFRIKLPRTKIQGHPSHREVIFLAYAPRATSTPSKSPWRGLRGKTSFVEGGNVIPGNLSFPVYAASYFTRAVDTTLACISQRPSRESKLCVRVALPVDLAADNAQDKTTAINEYNEEFFLEFTIESFSLLPWIFMYSK